MSETNEDVEEDPVDFDLLHIKAIGKVTMNETFGEAEHDPFIDDLNRNLMYPEDAP